MERGVLARSSAAFVLALVRMCDCGCVEHGAAGAGAGGGPGGSRHTPAAAPGGRTRARAAAAAVAAWQSPRPDWRCAPPPGSLRCPRGRPAVPGAPLSPPGRGRRGRSGLLASRARATTRSLHHRIRGNQLVQQWKSVRFFAVGKVLTRYQPEQWANELELRESSALTPSPAWFLGNWFHGTRHVQAELLYTQLSSGCFTRLLTPRGRIAER